MRLNIFHLFYFVVGDADHEQRVTDCGSDRNLLVSVRVVIVIFIPFIVYVVSVDVAVALSNKRHTHLYVCAHEHVCVIPSLRLTGVVLLQRFYLIFHFYCLSCHQSGGLPVRCVVALH